LSLADAIATGSSAGGKGTSMASAHGMRTRCCSGYAHVSLVNMVIQNVAEAKAHLSQLLDAALAGEEVIVARAGKPLVRLVPIEAPPRRELGFLPLAIPDELFAPLSGADLQAWQ
jgi:prevent-host-death family protein